MNPGSRKSYRDTNTWKNSGNRNFTKVLQVLSDDFVNDITDGSNAVTALPASQQCIDRNVTEMQQSVSHIKLLSTHVHQAIFPNKCFNVSNDTIYRRPLSDCKNTSTITTWFRPKKSHIPSCHSPENKITGTSSCSGNSDLAGMEENYSPNMETSSNVHINALDKLLVPCNSVIGSQCLKRRSAVKRPLLCNKIVHPPEKDNTAKIYHFLPVTRSASALKAVESPARKRYKMDDIGNANKDSKRIKISERTTYEAWNTDHFSADKSKSVIQCPMETDDEMEDESENSSLVSSLSSPFRSQLNLSDSETHDSSSLPDILRVTYGLKIVENPHVPSTAFASISASTMADLLSSMPNDIFLKHYILIDCRYPFEYDGGHIRGARNLFDPVKIEDVFYPRNLNSREPLYLRRPIFYCEFSQKRGPTMAHDLRAFDRMRNFSRYPLVDYPEMYLLEFGYSTFYRTYAENKPDLFEPIGYVSMVDEKYQLELGRYTFHRIRSSILHTLAKYRRKNVRTEHSKNRKHENRSGNPEHSRKMNQTITPSPNALVSVASSPDSPSYFPMRKSSASSKESRMKFWSDRNSKNDYVENEEDSPTTSYK